MKIFFSTIVVFCLLINSYGQINKIGIPFITNYTPQEYGASDQNWAIIQDNRGVVYIANNDNGILEYDGVYWREIPNKNSSVVRSLTVDKQGVVYVGCVSDFGKLSPTPNGNNYYHSYVEKIDSTKRDFVDIWNTHYHDSSIYYISEDYLFKVNNNQIDQIKLPVSSLFSFLLNEHIYIANYNKGILSTNDNKDIKTISGGEFYSEKGIYTMNNFNDKILVGTFPEGLYEYNIETKISSNRNINDRTNRFLKKYQLYSSSQLLNKDIVFGTIQNGAIVVGSTGKINYHYNKGNGLQDETIISSKPDNFGNIWMALNNGISKVEQNSPIKTFTQKNGLKGAVLDICKYANRIFVGTTSGVFYLSYNSENYPEFTQIKGLNIPCFSLLPIENEKNNHLLVGTNYGLYKIDNNFNSEFIDKQILPKGELLGTNYIQKLCRSKINPKNVFIALYDGVISIVYKNNKWVFDKTFPVKKMDIRHILEDNEGNIWFATLMNGVIRCNNNDTTKINYYNLDSGLPDLNENYIGLIDNKITIGTKKGLYTYDKEHDSFYKDSLFSDLNLSCYFFKQNENNDIWISSFNNKDKGIIRYLKNSKEIYIRNDLPLKRLPNQLYDAIFHDSNGITWLGASNGLYSFNSNIKVDYNKTYNTLVRKVQTKNDSIIFWGTNFEISENGDTIPSLNQPSELVPELDYYYNDLTFEFAAPYFIEEKKTVYSYKLEGYNNKWSKWSLESKAVFTNLSEGEYTFKAKAKNIYNYESTVANYKFYVSPPWYKTIVAYIIYLILGVFLLIIVVKLYTRKLEREKIILEGIVQERTAEIRQQNEVLKEQKEEILKQKEEITSSITYAQRIQRAIVPNEEKAACILKDFFLLWKPRDIVSGDFWWLGEKDGYVVVTAADCTGHGVPGAFMSMLGVSFLNEIVNQQSITESHEILNRLRNKVKVTLGQTDAGSTNKDGMDIALLVIDFKNMQAQFSGAYNPLYQYRNNELIETKATRNPIGVYIKEKSFEQNIIELQKGDVLYMFSDGFPDQFGGDKEKKYSTKRFKQLLLDIHKKPMDDQKQILDKELIEWRGSIEQIDDVIILGIRV